MLHPVLREGKYTEAELIKGITQHKTEAISQLYDLYAGALYGSILKSIKDREKADIILQVVFIKIYKEIRNYNPSKVKLFIWMLSIAINETLKAISSNKKPHNSETTACSSPNCTVEINPYLRSGVIMDIKKENTQIKQVRKY